MKYLLLSLTNGCFINQNWRERDCTKEMTEQQFSLHFQYVKLFTRLKYNLLQKTDYLNRKIFINHEMISYILGNKTKYKRDRLNQTKVLPVNSIMVN